MSDFAWGAFGSGLALTAGVELVLFAITWLIALRVGRFNVVDVTWGASFAAVAATSYLWSAGAGGDEVRRLATLALTAVWGLRLAAYIGWRSRGHGEDPRYGKMLERATGGRSAYALLRVYLPQAATAWFVSLPVQAIMAERSPAGALTAVGAAVVLVGMAFESVGDAQLAAFKADPANAGQVMDRGLWRYTRHPNYFGDACVWAGLWLIAAGQWPGAATIFSSALMIYFLTAKTGKPLLEGSLMAGKPGYRAYVARTSGFFPLRPKADRAV